MSILPELESIRDSVRVARELGFDFVELNAEFPFCLPDVIKETDIDEKIFFTVHLFEKSEVGLLYEPWRESQIEMLKGLMREYKKKVNVKRFNLHINRGAFFTMPDKKIFVFEQFEQLYTTACKKSFKELSDFAVAHDLEICFENVKIADYMLRIFKIIAEYPNLFYTLDVGHDIVAGKRASGQFMQNPEKIRHVHLHDVVNGIDHQQLGAGSVDVKKVLEFCRRNNTDIVVEVRRKEQLANSIKYLRKLLK
jgi:sugar phosphate isomerase/epimerase